MIGSHRRRLLRRQRLKDLDELPNFAGKGHGQVLRRMELIPVALVGKVCDKCAQVDSRISSADLWRFIQIFQSLALRCAPDPSGQ